MPAGDGGFHAGSREDPVVQEPCEGSSRHRLHHQGQDRVSGVAVSEGRAGREQQGVGALQEREHVAVPELSSLGVAHEGLVGPEPRGVTEEMPDQDVAAIRRKVRKNVSDTIVEAQPPIAITYFGSGI